MRDEEMHRDPVTVLFSWFDDNMRSIRHSFFSISFMFSRFFSSALKCNASLLITFNLILAFCNVDVVSRAGVLLCFHHR